MGESDRRQEWFEKMVRGLAAQGWQKAMDGEVCAYRAGSMKCAVGHIITDEAARLCGNSSVYRLRNDYRIDALGLGEISWEELEFLDRTQIAHDDAPPGDLRARFQALGAVRDLRWPSDVP